MRELLFKVWGPYKKFAVYHLRWQMGLILTPVMIFFIDYLHLQTWISLILFNIAGATLFYPIDKHIFAQKKQRQVESEQSQVKQK